MKLMLNGKEVSGMGHYVMAGDIKDATAEDSNVLSGKSYYNNNGKREGTMPNRGGMSAELAAGGSVSIPEGYHNGEGVVRAKGFELVRVEAEPASGGSYGVHNKTVQLNKDSQYVFLLNYKTTSKNAYVHFGLIVKGVMTVLETTTTNNTYNKYPALDENCVLSYGPGYSDEYPTTPYIYEVKAL